MLIDLNAIVSSLNAIVSSWTPTAFFLQPAMGTCVVPFELSQCGRAIIKNHA
jgi:hypothetical protein